MKVLTVYDTLRKGSGRFGRNEIDLYDFGSAPAEPNYSTSNWHWCYKFYDKIYYLFRTTESSGIGGYTVTWRIAKSPETEDLFKNFRLLPLETIKW